MDASTSGAGQGANVCARCGTDFGSVALTRIAGVPLCEPCAQFCRNRPFPTWIKASFAALLLLAVFAFLYNKRFFLAHLEAQRAQRLLKAGEIAEAARLFEAAAGHVPEEPQLHALADYLHGGILLQQDRAPEAVPLFRKAVELVPDNNDFSMGLLQAESNAAYDTKDYDLFLEKQQELGRRLPNDPIAALGIASAYACKYAVTGLENMKAAAEAQIAEALKMPGADGPWVAQYVGLVRYRLQTREMISREEFLRRFPDGRAPGAGQDGGGSE